MNMDSDDDDNEAPSEPVEVTIAPDTDEDFLTGAPAKKKQPTQASGTQAEQDPAKAMGNGHVPVEVTELP